MRFQISFRNKLDRLASPTMCYICQESYIGISVSHTPQGPIFNRCRKEKGDYTFSTQNSVDPKAQLKELENLTQVEEMLIACVSPILQVTHATSGQLKYQGHTINFPQNIESIAKKLPH